MTEITHEALEASDTRQALEEAFKVIHPEPSCEWKTWDNARIAEGREEDKASFTRWNDWRICKEARFRRFLDAEAWMDAAMMLVQGPAEYPDSKTFLIDCAMQTSVHSQPVAYVWDERGKHMGKGKTPAHALLAACLKARENGDG